MRSLLQNKNDYFVIDEKENGPLWHELMKLGAKPIRIPRRTMCIGFVDGQTHCTLLRDLEDFHCMDFITQLNFPQLNLPQKQKWLLRIERLFLTGEPIVEYIGYYSMKRLEHMLEFLKKTYKDYQATIIDVPSNVHHVGFEKRNGVDSHFFLKTLADFKKAYCMIAFEYDGIRHSAVGDRERLKKQTKKLNRWKYFYPLKVKPRNWWKKKWPDGYRKPNRCCPGYDNRPCEVEDEIGTQCWACDLADKRLREYRMLRERWRSY
jgi:hypothetical protein